MNDQIVDCDEIAAAALRHADSTQRLEAIGFVLDPAPQPRGEALFTRRTLQVRLSSDGTTVSGHAVDKFLQDNS